MRNVWFIQEFPIDNKNKIIQENFHRYWLSIAQVKRICIHQQTKLAFCLFVALAADWDSKLHGTEMRSLISTRKRQEQDRRLFFFFPFPFIPEPHWPLISIFTFCSSVPEHRPPRAPFCFSRFHSQSELAPFTVPKQWLDALQKGLLCGQTFPATVQI